ncbi:MAG: immunoglobulin domain-containing protein, partial [Planctomycetes bacterium]|nr:immunoglobulin domain-containing protein [Planctomycetota bacterium]
ICDGICYTLLTLTFRGLEPSRLNNEDRYTIELSTAMENAKGFTLAGDRDFEVQALGGNLEYQWRKDGSDIPGETGTTYSIATSVPSDSGDYTVVVSNDCNPTGIESTPGELTVSVPTQLGTITMDPPAQPVPCGISVTLSAPVTGIPEPQFQWSRNDREIAGATSDTFVIDSVTLADDGNYFLQATNAEACGGSLVETSPFLLDVDDNDPNCTADPPEIFNVDTVRGHAGHPDPLPINVTLDHVTNPPVTTESRIGGVHTLEIMFDQPMDPGTTQDTTNITVTAVIGMDTLSSDMLATLDLKGMVLTLTFPGLPGGALPNQDRYTIELSTNIEDSDGQNLAGDRDFDIRALEADVNGDGVVDPLDSGFALTGFGDAP